MARFDVYRLAGDAGHVLDVQSDLLDSMNTRVVVPLLPRAVAPLPAQRLNPIFDIEKTELVMATQFLAAVPTAELKEVVSNLSQAQQEITAALDLLFTGF